MQTSRRKCHCALLQTARKHEADRYTGSHRAKAVQGERPDSHSDASYLFFLKLEGKQVKLLNKKTLAVPKEDVIEAAKTLIIVLIALLVISTF